MGVSGISALKYLSTRENDEIYIINNGVVNDWKDKDLILEYVNSDRCFDQKEAYKLKGKLDLIVLSPGIAPTILELEDFKETKKICEVELAFNQLKRQEPTLKVVAVTGTNGKTTTVTLLSEALKMAGKKVFLGGNIGTPFCDSLVRGEKFDIAVLELSSFQLELMDQFHSDVSVLLNISKSHMERYDKYRDYKEAKLNILNNQIASDLFICSEDFKDIKTVPQKAFITAHSLFDFSNSKMVGDHNKENINVVDHVFKFLEIRNREEIIQQLVDSFRGVQFRLEFLREVQGTLIFNDGKSTNSGSTISALKSFKGKKVALLLGGKLRDESQDLSGFQNCGNRSLSVFSFGDAKNYISEKIPGTIKSDTIEEALKKVVIEQFDVVLFSPAFPSFDQYKNYIERGFAFQKMVEDLF